MPGDLSNDGGVIVTRVKERAQDRVRHGLAVLQLGLVAPPTLDPQPLRSQPPHPLRSNESRPHQAPQLRVRAYVFVMIHCMRVASATQGVISVYACVFACLSRLVFVPVCSQGSGSHVHVCPRPCSRFIDGVKSVLSCPLARTATACVIARRLGCLQGLPHAARRVFFGRPHACAQHFPSGTLRCGTPDPK